jgi:hypothetical protein
VDEDVDAAETLVNGQAELIEGAFLGDVHRDKGA